MVVCIGDAQKQLNMVYEDPRRRVSLSGYGTGANKTVRQCKERMIVWRRVSMAVSPSTAPAQGDTILKSVVAQLVGAGD